MLASAASDAGQRSVEESWVLPLACHRHQAPDLLLLPCDNSISNLMRKKDINVIKTLNIKVADYFFLVLNENLHQQRYTPNGRYVQRIIMYDYI